MSCLTSGGVTYVLAPYRMTHPVFEASRAAIEASGERKALVRAKPIIWTAMVSRAARAKPKKAAMTSRFPLLNLAKRWLVALALLGMIEGLWVEA